MELLALNIGSSSKKYTIENSAGERVHKAAARRHEGCFWEERAGERTPMTDDDFTHALVRFVDEMRACDPSLSEPAQWRAAIRLVMPGTYYTEHRVIDDAFVARLRQDRDRDPVHADPLLAEIDLLRREYPGMQLTAVSDSAFHRSLPPVAQRYALPRELCEELDLYRFGYHGLSVASTARQLHEAGVLPERTVVCHLGSGVSITALRDGASVETTMGFAPIEGIPMSTRSGDIGVGAVLELLRTMTREEVNTLCYTRGGLAAFSGYTNDMEVLVRERRENPDAKLAIDAFLYQIARAIAAHAASLGGIELLVFSGGIGERSTVLRREICTALGFLGIKMSEEKNESLHGPGEIAHPHSTVAVQVVYPDEEDEMLRVVRA